MTVIVTLHFRVRNLSRFAGKGDQAVVFGEVVLSCWIDTDSDAERLNVRLGKPL